MKRRRTSSSGAPGSRSQSSRPDFGELLRLVETAAEENNAEEIEALAAKGVDVSGSTGDDGFAAIHRAAARGSTEALDALLRAGADKDAVETTAGRTPLHLAALRSNGEAVDALLAAGADLEIRDAAGRTPLLLFCVAGPADPAIALRLLKAGAAGSAADREGVTPLDAAVKTGWTVVALAILASGTAPEPVPGNAGTLREAVRAGNASVVAALVGAGWEASAPALPLPRPWAPVGAVAVGAVTVGAVTVVEATVGTATVGAVAGEKKAIGTEAFSPLMLAADSGRPDVVRALLQSKGRGFPDAGDARGYTALHLATMRGSAEIAEVLLGEGRANPDVTNVDGDTALHVAVAARRINVGEVLLKAGASVHAANRRGHTALHFAAALGLAGFAKELLDRGADLAAVDGAVPALASASAPASALASPPKPRPAAARKPTESEKKEVLNERKMAKVLARALGKEGRVAGRASPKEASPVGPRGGKGGKGDGAAAGAGGKGGRGKRGSRGVRREGRTPLHFAAMNGRVEATRVLLEAGAVAGHRWNVRRESPLFAAARGGHAEVVSLLLGKMGTGEVDAPASSGQTPLSIACGNGHADVVDKLLAKGANVSLRDLDTHQSPLDMAVTSLCTASRARVARALLKAGADVNGADGQSPPLHAACRVGGDAETVETLLDAGADVEAARCGGKRSLRPIHVAAVHGNAAAVRALTLRGCRLDVETLDPSRSTALVLAVQQGHEEATRALIEAGADIGVVPLREDGTQRARSLAQLAGEMKRGDIVALLVQALVRRDSAESWTKEWAATFDVRAGADAGKETPPAEKVSTEAVST